MPWRSRNSITRLKVPPSLHRPSVTFHIEGLYRGREPSYCEEMHTFGARKTLSGKAITYQNNNRFLWWGGFFVCLKCFCFWLLSWWVPALIWFRKSCVLELRKLVSTQETANDDSLVELGLLEWTVEPTARRWKVMRCHRSTEPQQQAEV